MDLFDWSQGQAEDSGEAAGIYQPQPQHPSHFAHANAAMQEHVRSMYNPHGPVVPPPQMSCEVKPRLTKEQHDLLENHFQQQPKPSTQTKKHFAENLKVSLDKVNVSFEYLWRD